MCPGDHSEAVCSKNEAVLCSAGTSQRGTDAILVRKRRAVTVEEREINLKLKREKREIKNALRKRVSLVTIIYNCVYLCKDLINMIALKK